MKKILWLFLAVAFAAAPVFAQELKFSGYANYGLGLEYSTQEERKDTSDNVKLRVAGVDSSQIGGRFRLNGSYTNADKNVGADFRFQLQGTNATRDSTFNVGLVYAYGWVKPIDMLLVKAGLVADSTFETGGAILGDDAGGGAGAGAFIKLTPVSGLDIGFGAYPRSANSGSNNNEIGDIGGNTKLWEVKYVAGVAYTMPEIFKVNVSFRSYNNAGISSRSSARAVGEFRLLAVENLTAILEVELDKLWTPKEVDEKFGDFGLMNFFETVAYKIGDLTVGLNAAQYISNADNTDVGLRFNPWVSYALSDGKIVPRLDGIIFLAGDRVTDSTAGDYGKYDRKNDLAPTYVKDTKVFGARPSVKINFDSRTALEVGDVFYVRNKSSVSAKESFVDNVFYLDLVVRF